MFSKIRDDLNRRILYESMRPSALESMARAAMENPSYERTVRPRTPTWDFSTWLQEDTHFMGPRNTGFVLNSSLFNRIFQQSYTTFQE